MLILIGVESFETIRACLREHIVHFEMVVEAGRTKIALGKLDEGRVILDELQWRGF